jgi:hypothetical protein
MNIRCLVAALACALPTWVLAVDAERDRIAGERAAANARLAEQERECGTRFLVADCVGDARRAHREQIARLRQEQLKLDEARRRESVAARRKAIAERVAAQQARASQAASEPAGVQVRRAPEPAPPKPVVAPAPPRAPMLSASQVRQNTEKFEARARAAQERRESVARRNAERAAKGKVAAPLPVPSGASAPR